MTQDIAEPAVEPQPEEPDESVRATFARLVVDARAYVGAETEKQKLRAGIVVVAVRNAAIFGAIALMLVFAIIVALLIGLILTFAPVLGVGWATVTVLISAFLVAILLMLLAKARIGRMLRDLKP